MDTYTNRNSWGPTAIRLFIIFVALSILYAGLLYINHEDPRTIILYAALIIFAVVTAPSIFKSIPSMLAKNDIVFVLTAIVATVIALLVAKEVYVGFW